MKQEEPGSTGQSQAAMAGEWQHLRDDHHADPSAVARDVPDQEMARFIHDAAHMYPDAPWGEAVVRGQAEAWWQDRDWEREPQPFEDPAAWKAFFREVLGRDMPLNAEHEARLKHLAEADLLTPDMWTNGPDGTSCLPGFDAAALASERGGLSFPHLYQQRYLQLSAAGLPPQGTLGEAPGPEVSKGAATVGLPDLSDLPQPLQGAADTPGEATGTTSRNEPTPRTPQPGDKFIHTRYIKRGAHIANITASPSDERHYQVREVTSVDSDGTVHHKEAGTSGRRGLFRVEGTFSASQQSAEVRRWLRPEEGMPPAAYNSAGPDPVLPGFSLDFPDNLARVVPGRPARPRPATSQPSGPAPRRRP